MLVKLLVNFDASVYSWNTFKFGYIPFLMPINPLMKSHEWPFTSNSFHLGIRNIRKHSGQCQKSSWSEVSTRRLNASVPLKCRCWHLQPLLTSNSSDPLWCQLHADCSFYCFLFFCKVNERPIVQSVWSVCTCTSTPLASCWNNFKMFMGWWLDEVISPMLCLLVKSF